ALDELGPTDDDACLRPAEQLVAREADEIGPGRERLARSRLVADVHERAGAKVVEERQSMALRDRGELLQPRLLREPYDSEVGLVHAEEQCRLVRDRALVVRGARAVRRPDLVQPRAGARQHVRDAKAVAD